jgi:hypothetical protein
MILNILNYLIVIATLFFGYRIYISRKQGKKFTIIAMAEGAISDEATGKTKMVNVDNELIRQAESLGISLGRKE